MTTTNENEKYAYLAGFIDGDGSIYAQIKKNKTFKYKHQIQITVQVTQSTKRQWFLKQFETEIGAGNVRERSKKKEDTKKDSVSDYMLTEQNKIVELLKRIQPFLRLKKKQANLVIRIIEQLPSTKDSQDKFLEVCALVDQVSELNDTKKRTNTAETVRAELEGLSQDK
jgi:hypothetical protein